MEITSTAFEDEASIPRKYTCDGDNHNPPLAFHGVPAGTESLVLLMDDPDVPTAIRPEGVWDHWLVWNIPPTTTEIQEGEPTPGIVGRNTAGHHEYGGPCPPDKEHRYFFKLYALDKELDLPAAHATKEEIIAAMEGHVLASAELMGRYERGRG